MENLEERKIRIILALNEAKNAAPVGYVCQRCGVDETCETPCRNLKQLEEDGIIQRLPASTWSSSLEPRYELPAKTKKLIQQMVAARLEHLVRARV
jgi:DNA-binding HxlR family transcriptional regulator